MLHDLSSISHCDFSVKIPTSENPKPAIFRNFSKVFTRELVKSIILDSDKFYSPKRFYRRKFTLLGCEKYYLDNSSIDYVQKSFLHDNNNKRRKHKVSWYDQKDILSIDPKYLTEAFLLAEKLDILNSVSSKRILRHSIVAGFEEIWGKSLEEFNHSDLVVVSSIPRMF